MNTTFSFKAWFLLLYRSFLISWCPNSHMLNFIPLVPGSCSESSFLWQKVQILALFYSSFQILSVSFILIFFYPFRHLWWHFAILHLQIKVEKHDLLKMFFPHLVGFFWLLKSTINTWIKFCFIINVFVHTAKNIQIAQIEVYPYVRVLMCACVFVCVVCLCFKKNHMELGGWEVRDGSWSKLRRYKNYQKILY